MELRPSEAENLAGQDTGRDTLSHSKLALLLSCRRKFEFHYDLRLEPIRKSHAQSLGTVFQKAIELQDPEAGPRLLDGWMLNPPAVTLRSGGVIDGGPDGVSGWYPPEEPLRFYSQESEDQHRIDQAVVRAAAALYLRQWPGGPGETREFEYRVRLRNPWTGAYSRTFDLLGYADGVVHVGGPEWLNGGIPTSRSPLELIENKLVGRVDNAMVASLPLDQQVALARYGLWRATGRQVTKVHYRWIKKPSIKQRGGRKADKSDAETLEQFLDRIAEDYATRPEFYLVEEDPKFPDPNDLLRIECELWQWAEDVRNLRRMRLAPRSTARCTDYGGCHFLPICTGDPDAMALFRERPRYDVEVSVPQEAEAA